MKTYIVIVNYKSAALCVAALTAIEAQKEALKGGKVIVVDNHSDDGSCALLESTLCEKAWTAWVVIISAPRNGGFSYGNNLGIARALAENPVGDHHILLVNPDTVLSPGTLETTLRFVAEHPRAGIVGAPIFSPDGHQEVSAHRFPSATSELLSQARLGLLSRWLSHHDISYPPTRAAQRCEWISGAFFFIRADALAQVGRMDEGYFLYFEEVDYCARAARLGWEIWQADAPGLIHHEGASTGITIANKRRPAYWFDSRRRFFLKHQGVLGLLVADLFSALGRLSFELRKSLRLGLAVGADHQPSRYHADLLSGDLRHLWQVLKGEHVDQAA